MRLTPKEICLLFHTVEAFANYYMVDNHKTQGIGLLQQNLSHLQILMTRGRITARMMVDNNDGTGGIFIGPFKNFFGIDDNLVDGSHK